MICPKCNQDTLIEGTKNRWYCPYTYPNEYKIVHKKDGTEEVKEIRGQPCNFACGLAFFVDDNDVGIKSEVGLSIEDMDLSSRARTLIDSGVLSLSEIDRDDEAGKLEGIKELEQREDEWDEFNAMMREVVGRSASVHRTLSSGDSYRKMRSGGLVSRKIG